MIDTPADPGEAPQKREEQTLSPDQTLTESDRAQSTPIPHRSLTQQQGLSPHREAKHPLESPVGSLNGTDPLPQTAKPPTSHVGPATV